MIRSRLLSGLVMLFGLAVSNARGAAGAAPRAQPTPTPVDVCKALPGDMVAATLGGRLAQAVTFIPAGLHKGRCVYTLTVTGVAGEVSRTFVVWFMPPEEYNRLKAAQDDTVEEIDGLGDAAFFTFHPEGRRYDFMVLKRGVRMVEVTGQDPTATRKLAELAISRP